ncbi:uncharacterized protein N7500_008669 [Penicillium coprophilum]|uniref:uncharacterized protein n=1 Tax=Penicillium coprophilum TaxID=36646 RepID=UPI00238FF462|nr:uncharacterized protein N7500_008669 [Penicillium coprophilum]KAJ5159018.1 hypothetical protein N7500_008669 [Penicillium coprophilum]
MSPMIQDQRRFVSAWPRAMGVLARIWILLQPASDPMGDECVLLEEWGQSCHVKLVVESVIEEACGRGFGTAVTVWHHNS